MKLIVNVGLEVQATRMLSAHVAREILVANGFTIGKTRVIESDTEPTLVAELVNVPLGAGPGIALYQTACDLQQDCIAVYAPHTGKGGLIGPNHKAWGEFNPHFFFGLDGKRLTQEVTA